MSHTINEDLLTHCADFDDVRNFWANFAKMTSRDVTWRHHVGFWKKVQEIFLLLILYCSPNMKSFAPFKRKLWTITFFADLVTWQRKMKISPEDFIFSPCFLCDSESAQNFLSNGIWHDPLWWKKIFFSYYDVIAGFWWRHRKTARGRISKNAKMDTPDHIELKKNKNSGGIFF